MSDGKQLLWWALGIAGIAGGAYLLNLKRLSDELETETKVSIDKKSLTLIRLRIDFTLKNPTGGSVQVRQPFVKLSYKGNEIATSEITDGSFVIPKYNQISSINYNSNTEEGRKNPKPLTVNLSVLTLALKAPVLLKDYRTNGKLTFDITTVSTINDKLPYKKTENISIGGGQRT